MAGEAGAGVESGRALGGAGETGASGVCGTVLGGDGLKVGGGGGGTGLTVCARAWPIAKAAIIAASATAAKSAAAGRVNPVAAMSISSRFVGCPNAFPHQQAIGQSSLPDNPLIRATVEQWLGVQRVGLSSSAKADDPVIADDDNDYWMLRLRGA
jgi:hypothetical protein